MPADREAPPAEGGEGRGWVRALLLWAGGLALVGALLALAPRQARGLRDLVEAAGLWAPVLFVALQASRSFTWIPGNLLTPMGGFLFGPWKGLLLSWLGLALAALLAFAVARRVGRRPLRRLLSRHLPRLLDAFERHGGKGVLLARLTPGVPFNAVSYAAGSAGVRLRPYLLASVAGMVPRVAVQTIVGAGAGALGG